jgi:uncharacterized membrane protein YphA (DoxX/SURF4 family)
MKNLITQIFRVIIGVLFVFSGFVKLVDPIGSAYKFEEYFGADVLNLEFLIPYALYLSIFLIMAEIMLGIMLLVGFRPKLTSISLLLIMLIFLFLTWYSAYYNKVTDCGCFGDAVKLSTWETFYKNVIFTPMIIWLVYDYKNIRPIYSRKFSGFLTTLFFIIFSIIMYYVLNHLPLIDFRPYAVGKNIPEQMIYPKDAKKDIFQDTWIYKVNGEEKEFTTEEKPWEIEGAEFVDRKTILVEKGYEPPIHDFTMEKDGKDLTKQLMSEEKLMLIISPNLDKANIEGFENIKKITDKALNNGYTVYMMTASADEQFNNIKNEFNLDFDKLSCDETTLKTIIRANPGIMTVNKGTINGKWSYNDWDEVKIREGMGRKTTTIDFNLKKQIEDIAIDDKKYRSIIDAETPKERDSLMYLYDIPKDSIGTDFFMKQQKLDSINGIKIEKIIAQRGYPGKDLVGELNKDVVWSVIMHTNKVNKYMDLIMEAAENNQLSFPKAAEMQDLYLMRKGYPQIYGTQIAEINGEDKIWPIAEVEGVNIRRKYANFSQTVQQYAKKVFGKNYFFEPTTMDEVRKDPNYQIPDSIPDVLENDDEQKYIKIRESKSDTLFNNAKEVNDVKLDSISTQKDSTAVEKIKNIVKDSI